MPKGKYIRTEETKHKLSVSLSGINNPMYGKPLSNETKAKISIANTGRKHTAETCKKIGEAQLGERNHNYGKITSDETKLKLRLLLSGVNNPMYGRKHSEEIRKNISVGMSGINHHGYGKQLSEETKKKIGLANSGVNSPNYGKSLSNEIKNKISIALTGKTRSKESRRKYRLSTITYIEQHGDICPIIGKNEKALLDKQERIDGIPILRQCHLHTLGYYVDGCCVETNTVYEVYERRHLRPKVAARDAIRQKEIQSLLGCKFVIIWDI